MSCHFLFEFIQANGKVVGEISKAEGMALYFSVVFDTTFYEKGLLNSTKTFRRKGDKHVHITQHKFNSNT